MKNAKGNSFLIKYNLLLNQGFCDKIILVNWLKF